MYNPVMMFVVILSSHAHLIEIKLDENTGIETPRCTILHHLGLRTIKNTLLKEQIPKR